MQGKQGQGTMGTKYEQNSILLTKAEAAAALGFGVRWLEKQIDAGAPVVHIGRSVRLRRKDVEAFARDGKWPKTQTKESARERS
jgi:excisionase family DNA binding protein